MGHERIKIALVLVTVLALVGSIYTLAIRPSADTTAGSGVTLTVLPDKFRMRNADASNVLLKLTAGASFSGEVSLSVSGLPSGIVTRDTDPDSNSHYCSSACLAAPSQDFPIKLSLSPSQQTILNPTLFLTDGSIPAGTSTVTYTAATSSGTSSDTLTLVVAAEDPFTQSELKISDAGYVTPTLAARSGSSLTVQNFASAPDSVTADDGSFDTGPIPSFGSATLTVPGEGTYPIHSSLNPSKTGTLTAVTIQPRAALTGSTKGSPIEKPTLTAGESVTLTWTGSTGSAGQSVDLVTSSAIDSTMTVSSSRSSLAFSSESDQPTVDVTVTTKTTTPNGVYGVLLGTKHPDGSVYEPEAVSIKVTGSTASVTPPPPAARGTASQPAQTETTPAGSAGSSQGGNAPTSTSPETGSAGSPTSPTATSSGGATASTSPAADQQSTTAVATGSPSTTPGSGATKRSTPPSVVKTQAPPRTTEGARLDLSVTTGVPGAELTLTASGFPATTAVSVYWDGYTYTSSSTTTGPDGSNVASITAAHGGKATLGSFTTDDRGILVTTVRVPDNKVAAGEHRIRVTNGTVGDGEVTADATFTIEVGESVPTATEQTIVDLYQVEQPRKADDRQVYTAQNLVDAANDRTLAESFKESTVESELVNPRTTVTSLAAQTAGCQTNIGQRNSHTLVQRLTNSFAGSAVVQAVGGECRTQPIAAADVQLPKGIKDLLERAELSSDDFLAGFSDEAQLNIASKLSQWDRPNDLLEPIIRDLFDNNDTVRRRLPEDLDGYAVNNYLNTRLRHIYPRLEEYPEPYDEYCYVEPQRLRDQFLWWGYDKGTRGQGTLILYKSKEAQEVLRRQFDEADRQNRADALTEISSALLQLRGTGTSLCNYLAQFIYHDYIQLFGDAISMQPAPDFPSVYEQILNDWDEIYTDVIQRAFTRLELEALEEGVTIRLGPDQRSIILVSIYDEKEGYFAYLDRTETIKQIAAARLGIPVVDLMANKRPGSRSTTSQVVPTAHAQETTDVEATAGTMKTNYVAVDVGGVPMGLLITDPTGRSAGYNPVSGEEIHQLGEAVYEGVRTDRNTLFIPGLMHGEYELVLVPLADGDYSGTVHVAIGEEMLTRALTGRAVANQPITESISVSIQVAEPFASTGFPIPTWVWWLVGTVGVIGLTLLAWYYTLKRKWMTSPSATV